ncbi:MAG: hypothetical protein IJS39_00610 [Synergistaceae bacterium]|nr:hypothetical protein [Synergistaceae bacterium]
MTVLGMMTIVLLLAMVIIHDRRMSEIEQKQEELMRQVERLARRQGRPYA